MKKTFNRPVVFFDLEATGIDTDTARIIEIGAYRLDSFEYDATTPVLAELIDPGVPLPAEIVELTGITDDKLRGRPKFEDLARDIFDFFAGADVCGYNAGSYDVLLLKAEFNRAGLKSPFGPDTRIIDPFGIFRNRFNHKLENAYSYYTGREIDQDHRAVNDIQMTIDVLEAQAEKYGLDVSDAKGLERESLGDALDWQRHFLLVDDEVRLGFEKYKGLEIRKALRNDKLLTKAGRNTWFEWAASNVSGFAANARRAMEIAKEKAN